MAHAVRVIANWTEIDLLILYMGLQTPAFPPEALQDIIGPVTEAVIGAVREIGKPAALAIFAAYSAQAYQRFLQVQHICSDSGLPLYPSVQRAASAIAKLVSYHHVQ